MDHIELVNSREIERAIEDMLREAGDAARHYGFGSVLFRLLEKYAFHKDIVAHLSTTHGNLYLGPLLDLVERVVWNWHDAHAAEWSD